MNVLCVNRYTTAHRIAIVAVLVVTGVFSSCKKINVNEVAGPSITTITPDRGTAGTTVTFKGAHFGNGISANRVMFGRVEALVRAATDTQLLVTVPAHAAGAVDVTIMVNRKESRAVSFEYE